MLRFGPYWRLLCVFALILPSQQAPAQVPAQVPFLADKTNAPHARVVIVEDPGATQNLQPVPEKIQFLVDRAITNLTGKPSVAAAWSSLVSTQDTVGLK